MMIECSGETDQKSMRHQTSSKNDACTSVVVFIYYTSIRREKKILYRITQAWIGASCCEEQADTHAQAQLFYGDAWYMYRSMEQKAGGEAKYHRYAIRRYEYGYGDTAIRRFSKNKDTPIRHVYIFLQT